MEQARIVRIVVASPGDVMPERKALADVIQKLNQGIARQYEVRLELARWETDSHPGFHLDGPQGLIDSVLRIEDCDILIGIFWKRFGSPTKRANSGTEHEIQTAIAAWRRNNRPDVKVYFNKKAYAPNSVEETQQWGQVLEFQRQFPPEGMWWEYNGKAQFEDLVRSHLEQYLFDFDPKPSLPSPPNPDPPKPVPPRPTPVAPPVGVITRTAKFLRRKLVWAVATSVLLVGVGVFVWFRVTKVVAKPKKNPPCTVTNAALGEIFLDLSQWKHPPNWIINNRWLKLEDSPNIGYLSDKCFRNFTLTFQIKLGDDGGAAWALRVGEDHSNRIRYYLFYLSGPTGEYKDTFRAFKVYGDKVAPVGTNSGAPFPLKADCVFTVSVKVEKNSITHTFRLDDVPEHLLSREDGSQLRRAIAEERTLPTYIDPDDEFQFGTIGFVTKHREIFSITDLTVTPN